MRLFFLTQLLLSVAFFQAAAHELSCGYRFCLELRDDGTVYATGFNNYGQLGQGDIVDSTASLLVSFPATAVEVKATYRTSYALLSDGSLWGWGFNNNGNLGTGNATAMLSPYRIDAGPVLDFYVSDDALFFRRDTEMYFSGRNNGQYTSGGLILTPVHIPLLDGYEDIKEFKGVMCALHRGNLRLYCQGMNTNGWIDESGDSIKPMTMMFGGLRFQNFGINGYAVCVLDLDGNVRCSGWNQPEHWCRPESGTGILMANSVYLAVSEFNMGLVTSNGSVYMCGKSNSGQFGYGLPDARWRLTKVPDVNNAVSVYLQFYAITALTEDGGLWRWGVNNDKIGGPGATTPELIYSTGVIEVEPMADKNMRIGIGGETFWHTTGESSWGLLFRASSSTGFESSTLSYTAPPTGAPTTGSPTAPTLPTVSPTVSPTTSPTVELDTDDFACGDDFCIELRIDGTVHAIGRNSEGQLGQGDFDNRDTPTRVPLQTGAIWIGAYDHTAFALLSDGTLWAWGDGTYGLLGSGNLNSEPTPQLVSAGPVAEAKVGFLALVYTETSGDTYVLGRNLRQVLGNTSDSTISTPTLSNYLNDYRDVAVGPSQMCGIHKSSGELHCRGSNYNGEIDDTSSFIVTTMTPAFGGATVVTFKLENNVICGVLTSGELHCATLSLSYGCNPGEGVTLIGSNVVKLDITQTNLAFVNTAGEVWVCGLDNKGQHGQGASGTDGTLSKVPDVADADSILFHENTYFAVTTNGSMWAWGHNYYGISGNNATNVNNIPPTKILSEGVDVIRKGTSKAVFFGLEYESTWFTAGYTSQGTSFAGDNTGLMRATSMEYVSGRPTTAPTDSPTNAPTKSPTITGFCYSTADCDDNTELCDVNNACLTKPACAEHVGCTPYMLPGRAAYCESDVCHDRYAGEPTWPARPARRTLRVFRRAWARGH